MGFIDSWQDLMDTCESLMKNIFSDIEKNCQKELKIFGATLPKISSKIPRIKMREAQEIIFKRTNKDHRKEIDLEPEDEREICQFAKEKYGSELIFITHYPTNKRPFYTYPDPEDEDYTLSFDLLCRGLEIVTGGQRINDYKKLTENIKKWGNEVKDFKFYLQAFKYGMPPEGGFALGAERITKQILGLENIREASLFPRDMGRIDQRLAVLQPRTRTSSVRGKPKSKKKE
jgi:nondiscriminating aspartyl-tRNA synthetase